MVCHPPILCWNMCQVLDLVEHCFRKLNAVLGVFIFKPTLVGLAALVNHNGVDEPGLQTLGLKTL